ncbi:MAG TPA: GspH/FimT family pseudopilin [Candidatus Sulfotelmatobacter sp.]|nr:GspH/FimT family pseudopilin [Candidatus Sulfotelmatobacter sp.]
MKSAARDERGFTLAELMVVISILGLLFALTVPTVSSFMRSSRLVGAAQTLEADIHYAHTIASTSRKTCIILFSGATYQVEQLNPTTTLLTREMPNGVSCSASDTATFYPWGLTDPVSVTVSDSHDSSVVQIASNGRVVRD